MEFTVQRRWATGQSVIGELGCQMDAGLRLHMFTLEPPMRDDGVKPRAIPAGRYRLTWRYSPKHGGNVPHVEEVPGFEEIEIHAGNFPKDTEGCTLVALSYSPQLPDFIGQSKPAHDALYAVVAEAAKRDEYMWITYLDPPTGDCNAKSGN